MFNDNKIIKNIERLTAKKRQTDRQPRKEKKRKENSIFIHKKMIMTVRQTNSESGVWRQIFFFFSFDDI